LKYGPFLPILSDFQKVAAVPSQSEMTAL